MSSLAAPGGPVMAQGGASELVFSARPVAEAIAADRPALGWQAGLGPEYARNDAQLAVREPARVLTAIDTWPQPARPQIRDYQRLRLSTSPFSPLVYQPGSSWRRHRGPHYGHAHFGSWSSTTTVTRRSAVWTHRPR